VVEPTKLLQGLVSPAVPSCWLLYPVARTPRAESFSVGAEVPTWDFTSARILCQEKGLSSLPPAETHCLLRIYCSSLPESVAELAAVSWWFLPWTYVWETWWKWML